MRDVNHAIDNLRQLTQLPDLDFDGAGNLSLIFDGSTAVNIARIDDKRVEFWSDIAGFGTAGDIATLRSALESNHLGEGTGAARLALAPGRDTFVLCERVDVEPLSDSQFGDRIVEFLKHVTFWNSPEGARAALSRSSTSSTPDVHEFVIRA
jgi:hypothetical protein